VASIGSTAIWRRNTSSLQPVSGRIPPFTAEYTRAVVAEDNALTESGARRCSLLPYWSSSPWLSSCCPPTLNITAPCKTRRPETGTRQFQAKAGALMTRSGGKPCRITDTLY
jgi:hypothetical protein